MLDLTFFNTINNSKATMVSVNGNYILFDIPGAHNLSPISIYEFAHMCRRWALLKGYRIVSEYLAEEMARSKLERMYDDVKIGEYFDSFEPISVIAAANALYFNKH